MKNFNEMGLSQPLLRAIDELGFENPMPVQGKVIPMMLEGERDIIALAQTGTGKTAAFGLPVIENTDAGNNAIQTLILCPTRELCMQISGDLSGFAKYSGDVRILPVYGGSSIENQIRELKRGVQIVVATPGRLIDLIGRRAAKLGAVTTVVLDEADEMLNMGFLDSINEILEEVPQGRRTLLFSATMSPEISAIAKNYMTDPVEVTIGTKNSSAENIEHVYYLVHAKDKYKVLKRIADSEPDIYGIIFCRTRKETQEIASKLMDDGYNADSLHGDLSQAQRDAVMQKFRQKTLSLLVATDVAARGLDVDSLTHVINYSLPDDTEVYTHRSGRTGRAGKTGVSVSIVHLREKQNLQRIERLVKKQFTHLSIPTGSEICSRQLFHWVSKLEAVDTEHREIEKFLPEIKQKLSGLDREELLRRVVSLEFDRFLDDYRHGEEIIEPVADKREKGRNENERRRTPKGDIARLFINLGSADSLSPESLISLINERTRGHRIDIGKIDIMKSFSFFEVDEADAVIVTGGLNNSKFKGKRIAVEAALAKEERNDSRGGKPEKRNRNTKTGSRHKGFGNDRKNRGKKYRRF
jgi:ATP-dependent RNA helicase DeaD